MPTQSSAFQLKVNEEIFNFTTKEIGDFDIIATSPNSFNLLTDHRSVNAVVEAIPGGSKTFQVKIDGEVYNVLIQDELDQMLDQMGFGKIVHKVVKEIKAPMPGLVLEIAVILGQEVKQGDKLIILEAMKMENSLQAGADAVIKKINVTKGQPVIKGQVLIELE
jgi:acetyl/propionyl-CoA carboxylase alpha subunit